MFVIYSPVNNIYVHTKGKIITFESTNEASQFLQAFSQYSMTRGMAESPFEIQNILSFFNNIQVEPFTDKFTCESISWKEYKDSKERKNN